MPKSTTTSTRSLAVITGASAGLGVSFARALAARGHDLLLVARRVARLEALARDLAPSGVSVEVVAADLTDSTQLEALAQRIQATLNLGILVNNAGFGTSGYFWETDPDSQARMTELHITATTRLTHAAIANLFPRAQAGTGVIQVSSVAAFGVAPQNVSYNASKAWMNHFSAGLALELDGRGSPITIQALCPGFTLTEFHDVMKMDRAGVPGWLWLTPDYVVRESLQAFDRGELFVVPARKYRWATYFMRLAPAVLLRRMSAAAVRRYRRKKHGA